MSLSRRAEAGLANCFKSEGLNALYANDPYHHETNPNGYIKLCSADNILPRELINEKFTPSIYSTFDTAELNFYPRPGGEPSTREVVANFINHFCAPNLKRPISKDELVLVSGVTNASDLLSHAIFDEGDVLLTFAPFYYRFPNDFGDRGLIHVEAVNAYNEEVNKMELKVDSFEAKLQELQNADKKVKALLLVNPRNPDGGVFSLDELKPIIDWAVKKHSLYIILDEIYNLTVFDPLPNGQRYESAIQLFDADPSLDQNLLVWMWGLSKIFSIPGLRVGVIYSPNLKIRESVLRSLMYQGLNVITQHFVRELLKDHSWAENFFQANQAHLKEAKDYCKTALEAFSTSTQKVRILDSQSAFFIMADFSDFLKTKTWEGEHDLQERFKAAKVLIVAGQTLFMPSPGWFRIVFSAGSRDEMDEGIRRIGKALNS